MTRLIFRKTVLALFLSTSFQTFAAELELPKATIDHCKTLNLKSNTTLSEQFDKYSKDLDHNTGVYVLEQGAEAMLTRAWLSDNAEKTIDVQYFIFSTDNIGRIATDYLIRAAERGVKVRLLVDDLMVDADENELLHINSHPNITIKIYNPNINIGKNITHKLFNLFTDFHGINQRMHNKTFTVDGKVSITGGRNIADEYFGYDHAYNFRDRDVLLIGNTTKTIQSSFEDYWNHDLSVAIDDLIDSKIIEKPNFDDFHQYACNPDNFVPIIRQQIKDMPNVFESMYENGELHLIKDVEYITDLPGKNDKNEFLGGSGVATDKLIKLIKEAKHTITIQTPYLVTTELGRGLLTDAVKRGVNVRILTNSMASNDNLEAFSGYQRDRSKLLKTGAHIFEFRPDAQIRRKVMSDALQSKLDYVPIFGLHAKTMVIDEETTIIGTFNLDPRSANLNTESIVIIPSKDISQRVEHGMIIEMLPENAWQITEDWNPDSDNSFLKRLKIKSRIIVPKSIL